MRIMQKLTDWNYNHFWRVGTESKKSATKELITDNILIPVQESTGLTIRTYTCIEIAMRSAKELL